MRPYPSQPTPLNWHTPFDQGDLIPCTGSSTNPSPPIRPCRYTLYGLPHHVPPTLLPRHKNRVYQTTWFSPQTGDVLNHVSTFSPRQLHIPNHMATLNQSTAISFQKRMPWHLIWFKHAAFKKPSSCNISSFCNYTSNTLVKIFEFSNVQIRLLEFSYTFHKMVWGRFIFYIFHNLPHTGL